MKLFVTGGTGFIGTHFVQQALAKGHEVIAQRRLGSHPRLPLKEQPAWVDRPLDANFEDVLGGCDALVHFASHTPNPPYAPLDECLYWNVVATIRLIQQAALQGVTRILIAGTCFEYGLAAEDYEFVHPGAECRPTLTYPISKAAATTSCLGLARQLGLQMQVLRIFQVYGEGEAATRFWPSLRSAALSGQDFAMSSGVQVRDFIPVEDVARHFLAALSFQGVEAGKPQIKNVGSGQAKSLLEFAEGWWKSWNASGNLRPGNVGIRIGEVSRLVADVKSIHV
ncbi:MAG: NAD-dependent epimerase/dehydratase family protein [Fluviibacter sp.]